MLSVWFVCAVYIAYSKCIAFGCLFEITSVTGNGYAYMHNAQCSVSEWLDWNVRVAI